MTSFKVMLRKLLDPDYATRKVEVIQKQAKKDLKKTSRRADNFSSAIKKGDVTMVMLITAGGGKKDV